MVSLWVEDLESAAISSKASTTDLLAVPSLATILGYCSFPIRY